MSRGVNCDNCDWGGDESALLAGDACPNCASTTALRACCGDCGEPEAMYPRHFCERCNEERLAYLAL